MILLDGKKVAADVIAKAKSDVDVLKSSGVQPKLVVVQVGEDPASVVYVGQKLKRCKETGIESVHAKMDASVTTEEIIAKVHTLNNDSGVHGILVQLPLPAHVNTPLVMKAIDPKKDVDGFTAYNVGKMTLGTEFERLTPCTAQGVIDLLEAYKISVEGKEVVMVGASNVVGKPLAIMMLNRGATITVCHIKTQDLAFHTKRADILCVAVGKRNLITADMVKDGVTVVDIGINRDPEGKLCGDTDFEALSKKAYAITPVPGGVGQMTVACLMANIVKAAQNLHELSA